MQHESCWQEETEAALLFVQRVDPVAADIPSVTRQSLANRTLREPVTVLDSSIFQRAFGMRVGGVSDRFFGIFL
jgi:hypothetical protein